MKKNCMFQYAFDRGVHSKGFSFSDIEIKEDTGLITERKALELWEKYLPDFIYRLKEDNRPEMCIWTDCDSETDYHTQLKNLDYRDNLVVRGNEVYKQSISEELVS